MSHNTNLTRDAKKRIKYQEATDRAFKGENLSIRVRIEVKAFLHKEGNPRKFNAFARKHLLAVVKHKMGIRRADTQYDEVITQHLKECFEEMLTVHKAKEVQS